MRKSVLLPLILLVAMVASGVGYGVLDAYNLVPGILTLENESVDMPETVEISLTDTGSKEVIGINEHAAKITAAQVQPLMQQLVAQAQNGLPPNPDSNDPAANMPVATGSRVGAIVIDTASGKTLGQVNADQLMTPASSSKIVAAATALKTLGPDYRFTTSTHLAGEKLFLRGNGDQLLSAGSGNPAATAGHAGLADLAAQTTQKLKDQKTTTVQLFLDESAFGDQNPLANWQAQGNDNYETKPTPIAINNGLANPELSYGYLPDPGLSAAEQFAARLKDQGIKVGQIQRGATPNDARKIGEVKSAPLHEVMHETLKESNNMLAEVLCRASAAKAGTGTNFSGEIKIAQKVLNDLKLEGTAFANHDCSGLSTENQIKPQLLAALMQQAARGDDPQLRPLVASLPIGALDGTLHDRYLQANGAGNVRAKTGSLQNSRALTGLVTTKSGRTLTFCVIVDSFKEGTGAIARGAIDNFVNGLAGL